MHYFSNSGAFEHNSTLWPHLASHYRTQEAAGSASVVASRLITWLQTVYVSFAAPSSQPRNVQLTPKSSTQLEITWEAPTLVDWNSEHLSYKVGYKYGRQTYKDVIKCKKSQPPAAAVAGSRVGCRWVGWVSNMPFLFHVQASWWKG